MEGEAEDYQDAYVFLRRFDKDNTFESIEPLQGRTIERFAFATGPYAALYIIKGEKTPDFAKGFAEQIAGFDVSKALSAGCTDRIVHMGTFNHMAFVRVWVRGGHDPHQVLLRIRNLVAFKGGCRTDGEYDLLIEFGDDASDEPVLRGARAVRGTEGVDRSEVDVAYPLP